MQMTRDLRLIFFSLKETILKNYALLTLGQLNENMLICTFYYMLRKNIINCFLLGNLNISKIQVKIMRFYRPERSTQYCVYQFINAILYLLI